MIEPAAEADSARTREDAYHRRLFDRSVVLPSTGNTEGRISLADSMIGLAILAPCFALLRESPVSGVVALNAVFPALVRTHVILNRRRSVCEPINMKIWATSFFSSLLLAAVVLGVIALGCLVCLVVGGNGGYYLVKKLGYHIAVRDPNVGGLIGCLIFAIPWMGFSLYFLAPRILEIREPASSHAEAS